jgi:hypothetical protein
MSECDKIDEDPQRRIFIKRNPPPYWFRILNNATCHVSPEADHETNKGVPKAFTRGLYFARTKCWNSSTSLDGFVS